MKYTEAQKKGVKVKMEISKTIKGVQNSIQDVQDTIQDEIASKAVRKSTLKSILNDQKKYNKYSDNVFDKVDKNKNGYIEKDELAHLIQEMVNKLKKETNIPEDKVEAALKLIDTDRDGKISKEEFRNKSRTKLLSIISS